MRHICHLELFPDINDLAPNGFNKMHVKFHVQVEVGISGLKRKWCQLMK